MTQRFHSPSGPTAPPTIPNTNISGLVAALHCQVAVAEQQLRVPMRQQKLWNELLAARAGEKATGTRMSQSNAQSSLEPKAPGKTQAPPQT